MGPKLINNTLLNMGDDGIAIHGRYYLVVAVSLSHRSDHACKARQLRKFCYVLQPQEVFAFRTTLYAITTREHCVYGADPELNDSTKWLACWVAHKQLLKTCCVTVAGG